MQTARSGHGSQRLTWLASTLALFFFAAADGKPLPRSVLALSAGHPTSFAIDSRHHPVFSLALDKGDYAQIRIEQLHSLALARIERPDGALGQIRFRDTGKHGIIRISWVAAETGVYRVRLSPYHRGKSAGGVIRLSALRPATSTDRRKAAAEALLAHAEWSRHQGAAPSWPQALRDYQAAASAARTLGDTPLLRAALTGESRLQLYRLNEYRAALTLARAAVAVAHGERDLPGEALAWKQLGTAQYYLADYSGSIRSDRRALALYRSTGDLYWQGIVLGNIGYTYREMGRTALALRAARKSLAIARSIHDWFGVDFNLEALGDFRLARGEFDRSFADYQQALELMRSHPYPQEAAAVWKGIGELFELANEPAEARSAFRKALQLAARAHDSSDALEVLAHLGEVSLQRGDAGDAMRYYRQGIERATALGLPREESFLLTGLASALAASGHGTRALANYHRAIALARKISQNDAEAAAWQALGDHEARSGRSASAKRAYERSFQLWSRQSNRVHMATALASLARLEFQRGALASARAYIERSLTLIGTSRSTLTDRDLRTAYFASQHAYYDLGVSILMALQHRFARRGFALQALQLAERARARTLLDALHRAGHVPVGLIPADLAQALRRNREQLDAAYARWRDLLADTAADSAQFDALRKRIESLQRTGDELEALARARSRRYAAVAGARPAQIGQVQRRLLGPHTAMVYYWVGKHRGYAWLIRRTGIRSWSLPGAGILGPQVRELRRAITARIRVHPGESVGHRLERVRAADARARTLARMLGAQILPDARTLVGLHTLYVVADGPLYGVPFAALRPPGSPDELIRTTAVLREPSASVLLSLPKGARPLEHGAASVAVFADPVYTREDPRLRALSAQRAKSSSRTLAVRWASEENAAHLPRLIGSRTEALGIEHQSGAGHVMVRMGFAATVRAVRHLRWRRFNVVDFAVHTLLNVDHPEFSGLVLTMFRPNGKAEDGVLWLRDIYSLDIPVNLVVLSGCRTLEGHDVPGAGLIGLYQAFLMAGAHAVLGSLWSVQDRPTGRLMTLFYANLLHRHMTPAEALRAAQLSLENSRGLHALYYWAGFSIEGAGARAL